MKAADPRHVLLDPEVITLNPLLQVLGDVMEWISRQEPLFPGGRDGRRVGAGTICADPVGCEQGLVSGATHESQRATHKIAAVA